MRGHHDALRRVLEVLTLGPCGPLLVKQSARLARALKAVDWTKLKKADWAQVQGWAIRPPVLIAGALLLHVRGRARSRARRVARLHALRRLQLKERRALTHSKGLDELPSWLSRPNFEDPAWLNTLLAKLWPFVAKTLQGVLNESLRADVERLIQEELSNAGVEGAVEIALPTLQLGTIAPKFKDMQVLDAGADNEVKLRTTVEFIGDPAIVVAIQSKLTPRLLVRLTHFQLSGNLQFTLAPLLPQAPFVGAFSMLFMDTPSVRYDLQLKPVKGLPNISLSMIPGVQDFLDVVLKNILRQYIVFPHEEDPDGKKMAMGVTELGKLRVVVEKARNLPDADWGFMGMGKSDPYVRLGVGMQGELPANFKQTKTIDDDLNPTWDEIFQFGVHSTTIQELVIEVWDEDNAVTGDELLGTCQVDIGTTIDGELSDGKWYTLLSPLVDSMTALEPPQIFLRLDWVTNRHLQADPNLALIDTPLRTPLQRALGVSKETGLGPARRSPFSRLVQRMLSRHTDATRPRTIRMLTQVPLPGWMCSPDVDSAHFLNDLVGILWPFIHQLAGEYVQTKNRCGTYDIPVPMMDLKVKCDMGAIPNFMIQSLKVITTSESELILDLEIGVGGDMEVGAGLRLFKCPLSDMRFEVQQVVANATVRMHMRPLIPTLPYVANVNIQVIGETFVDFKLMVKPSRLLPSLDVASIPLFRTITNYLINQALKHTLRLPRGLLVPILDPEEPSVYFHLDTTGRIEGSLAIEVLGLAVPQGPRQSMLSIGAVTDAAGALAETALQSSISTSSALLTMQFNGKKPAVYAVVSTDTALDSFEVLKNRPYEDKFQRTKGLEKEAADCMWGEQMEFLVDAPDEVLLTVGVFNEFPVKPQPKYWRGDEDQLHELSAEARQYQESAVGSRSLLDIPWSYDFWYNVLSDSMDVDPLDPTTWNKSPPVWPGEARRKGKSFVFNPIPIAADEEVQGKQRAPVEAPSEAETPEVQKTYAEVVAEPANNGAAEEMTAEETTTPTMVMVPQLAESSSSLGLLRTGSYDDIALPALSDVSEGGADTWRSWRTATAPAEKAEMKTEAQKAPTSKLKVVSNHLDKGNGEIGGGNGDAAANATAPAVGESMVASTTALISPSMQERAAAMFTRKPAVPEPFFEFAQKDVEEIDTSVGRMLHTEVVGNGSNVLGAAVLRVAALRSGKRVTTKVPLKSGPLKGSALEVALQWKPFKPLFTREMLPREEVRGVLMVHLHSVASLEKTAVTPKVEFTVGFMRKYSSEGSGRDAEYNELLCFPNVRISRYSVPNAYVSVKQGKENLGFVSLNMNEVLREGKVQGNYRLTQVQTGSVRLDIIWKEEAV